MSDLVAGRGGAVLAIVGLGLIIIPTKWLMTHEVRVDEDPVAGILLNPDIFMPDGFLSRTQHPIRYWCLILGFYFVGLVVLVLGMGLMFFPSELENLIGCIV